MKRRTILTGVAAAGLAGGGYLVGTGDLDLLSSAIDTEWTEDSTLHITLEEDHGFKGLEVMPPGGEGQGDQILLRDAPQFERELELNIFSKISPDSSVSSGEWKIVAYGDGWNDMTKEAEQEDSTTFTFEGEVELVDTEIAVSGGKLIATIKNEGEAPLRLEEIVVEKTVEHRQILPVGEEVTIETSDSVIEPAEDDSSCYEVPPEIDIELRCLPRTIVETTVDLDHDETERRCTFQA